MKEKRQKEKTQDNATTNKKLKYLVEKLEQIATFVCDGCANSIKDTCFTYLCKYSVNS